MSYLSTKDFASVKNALYMESDTEISKQFETMATQIVLLKLNAVTSVEKYPIIKIQLKISAYFTVLGTVRGLLFINGYLHDRPWSRSSFFNWM